MQDIKTTSGTDAGTAGETARGTAGGQDAGENQKTAGIAGVIDTFRERGLWSAMVQFIKFGMIGGVNTVIAWCIVNGSVYLLHWDKLVGVIIANILTIFISFMLNSRFVFDHAGADKKTVAKSLFKVYASYAFTGFVVSGALLILQSDILGIPVYIATILNLIVTIPLNFLLNKFWVYRKKR